jgi:hypothetical protein
MPVRPFSSCVSWQRFLCKPPRCSGDKATGGSGRAETARHGKEEVDSLGALELESDVDEIFRTAKAGIPNSAFPVPSKPLQPFNQLLIAGRS